MGGGSSKPKEEPTRFKYHGPLSRNSEEDLAYREGLAVKGRAFAVRVVLDVLAMPRPAIAATPRPAAIAFESSSGATAADVPRRLKSLILGDQVHSSSPNTSRDRAHSGNEDAPSSPSPPLTPPREQNRADKKTSELTARWKEQLITARLLPCPVSLLRVADDYDFSRCENCFDGEVDDEDLMSSAFAISYPQLRVEGDLWEMPPSLKTALGEVKDKRVWLDRMAKFQNDNMQSEWAVAGALPYVNYKVLTVVPTSEELKSGKNWNPRLLDSKSSDVRAMLQEAIALVANMRTEAIGLHAVEYDGQKKKRKPMLDIMSAATVVHAIRHRMPTVMSTVGTVCHSVGHLTIKDPESFSQATVLVPNPANDEVLEKGADVHSLMRAWPVSERMLGRSFGGIHLTQEGDIRLSATLAMLVLWCENRRFQVALNCKPSRTTRVNTQSSIPLASFLTLENSSIDLVGSIVKTFRGAKLVNGMPSLTARIVEEFLDVAKGEGYVDHIEKGEAGVFALSQDPTFFRCKIDRPSDKIDMFLGLHGWTTTSNLTDEQKLDVMCMLLGVGERHLSRYGTSPLVRRNRAGFKIPHAVKRYSKAYLKWIEQCGCLISSTFDRTERAEGDCTTPLSLLSAATPTVITTWILDTSGAPEFLRTTSVPAADLHKNGSFCANGIFAGKGLASPLVNPARDRVDPMVDPVPVAWRSAWTGWDPVASATFLFSPNSGIGVCKRNGIISSFSDFEKTARADWPLLWLSAVERGFSVDDAFVYLNEIFEDLRTSHLSFETTVVVLVRKMTISSSHLEVIAATQDGSVVNHEICKWCIKLDVENQRGTCTAAYWADFVGKRLEKSVVTIIAKDGSRVRVPLRRVISSAQTASPVAPVIYMRGDQPPTKQ